MPTNVVLHALGEEPEIRPVEKLTFVDASAEEELGEGEVTPEEEIFEDLTPRKAADAVVELVVNQKVPLDEARRMVPHSLDPDTDRLVRETLTGYWLAPKLQRELVRASRVKGLMTGLTDLKDPDADRKLALDTIAKFSDQIASDPDVGLKKADIEVNIDLSDIPKMDPGEFAYAEETE